MKHPRAIPVTIAITNVVCHARVVSIMDKVQCRRKSQGRSISLLIQCQCIGLRHVDGIIHQQSCLQHRIPRQKRQTVFRYVAVAQASWRAGTVHQVLHELDECHRARFGAAGEWANNDISQLCIERCGHLQIVAQHGAQHQRIGRPCGI